MIQLLSHFMHPVLFHPRWAILTGLFALLPAATIAQSSTNWLGVTTFWRDASNWQGGLVPSASVNTTISKSDTTNDKDAYVPVPLPGDTATTRNLTIQQGGILRFDSLGLLLVYGTESNQNLGSVYLGYGTIVFKNNIEFKNGGIFDCGGGVLRFSGSLWDNKSGSIFDPGTSTVVFDGTGDQTLKIDSTLTSFSFYNLDVVSGGTVSINGNVTVTGDCHVAPGCSINVSSGSSFIVEGTFTGEVGSVGGAGTAELPVQISFFTVTTNRLDAVLRWSTATEVNNYGFEIQRRRISQMITVTHRYESHNDEVPLGTDPQWMRVGFVRGSGTSSQPNNYSFSDSNIPAGRYAYRLKQIDFDGTAAYYSAAEIELGLAPKELMLGDNYPNPFNPSTRIEFTLPEPGRARLSVYNMIGQRVATLYDGDAEAGRFVQVTFSADGLSSGIYFYQLEFGSQRILKRMLLVK